MCREVLNSGWFLSLRSPLSVKHAQAKPKPSPSQFNPTQSNQPNPRINAVLIHLYKKQMNKLPIAPLWALMLI